MLKFFAYTDKDIKNKQQIINFASRFHRRFPKFTFSPLEMMKTPRMAYVFNMLGASHYRLVAKYGQADKRIVLYQQADPELKTVASLRKWLSRKDVHLCMGLTGRPISFEMMWVKLFKMDDKGTGFALQPYPGSFDPKFKANPSDYVMSQQFSKRIQKTIKFTTKPSHEFKDYLSVPHVYLLSNKRAFHIAHRLWVELYQKFHNVPTMSLPDDPATKTYLLQEFVKEFRLTFLKMNDKCRPVAYVRAAYTVPLDIGILRSEKYKVEEWTHTFKPVSKSKLLREFVNDALIPNQWFKENKHKPSLAIFDFGGAYKPHYRYLYDLRIPSTTRKGVYSIVEFDIVPGKKPITDKRTHEVLRPMKNNQSKNKK